MRIVVFISGRGSNLRALLEHQENYTICHVISNRHQAAGLSIAQEYRVPTTVISWHDGAKAEAQALTLLNDIKPDLIVLAGFMRVLSADFVTKFSHKIINIHPSLLPLYPGLNTHQRALNDQQIKHGATVHFVDQNLDQGHRISQCHIRIGPEDTAETLAARLLSKEHKLLTTTVDKIATGQIYWQDKHLYYNNQVITQPLVWPEI
ncbi:MAG: phosphoribosylglycinamide formyltransferase [Proteobacteria bacterium]|nr:MAG: phosphoribosylglycinamide formyltransferase [Pseudomonadota bacterium]